MSETIPKNSRALYALLELSKALSSEVDLDDLLRVIVEKASSVMEAERTSIFVFDVLQNRLWTRVAQGLGDTKIELAVGSGVAGDVARTLALSNIEDAYLDPRFNPESDRRTGYRTRSILSAPVLDSHGNLLGVIQSVNKTTARTFDSEDELLMLALASHVAVAMERARLIGVYLENERLEESLKVAHEIQMRMLPAGAVTLPEDSPFNLHASIRPARQVGGDLYDFFWDDERLYFCIGDVAGKGVGSALVMALTKTLFRANARFLPDPAEVMTAVNARLHEETDPTMFVTAFCGFLDLRDGRLLFSNAGHDRPLVLRKGTLPRVLESIPGLALGVLPQFTYVLQETKLLAGESLFLYTDGVTDADNPGEEMFSLQRMLSTLEGGSPRNPSEAIAIMTRSVDEFSAGAQQVDDITMLCVQYRGRVTPREPSGVNGSFRRSIDSLPGIFQMAGRFRTSEKLDDELGFAIDFGLEEIFTNMVKYNAAGDGEIRIELMNRDGEIVVALTDPDAPRFDINRDAADVDISEPLETRTPGGLGIHLVKKMMDRVEYSHENRTARITMVKRVE
ncbi:MAG TPA: SpoIIE family protein phosphatase [Thermoanaerobaculia bacterium]|nr:SpoIIE family protein phosphatase [Thermoanaerobaculia bacterium]